MKQTYKLCLVQLLLPNLAGESYYAVWGLAPRTRILRSPLSLNPPQADPSDPSLHSSSLAASRVLLSTVIIIVIPLVGPVRVFLQARSFHAICYQLRSALSLFSHTAFSRSVADKYLTCWCAFAAKGGTLPNQTSFQ